MVEEQVKLAMGSIVQERYRVVKLLGAGGMSTVYLVDDLKLPGKRWAMKAMVLTPHHPHHFAVEMDMLVQLDHPHLPSIVDYYPPDETGTSYVIMDYIQGQTLQQWFEQQQHRLSVRQVLKISLQICDLLCYLHTFKPQPIIYRDLKPTNLLIDAGEHVYLIDFGIARQYKIGQQADTISMGTIGFAAPEQFADEQTDERTDLYSLGALMYYLLSGGKMYYLTEQPLSHDAADVPESLEQVIAKLLQPLPQDRYRQAQEVKQQLADIYGRQLSKSDEPMKVKRAKLAIGKTIVVGSVSAGAGATFIAMALARVLNTLRLDHAVLEFPTIMPALYSLLRGDVTAPKHYLFLEEQWAATPARTAVLWKSDYTSWYPLHPHHERHALDVEYYAMRALYALRDVIKIVDIGTSWFASHVGKLCLDADEIIVIVDGQLPQLNTMDAQKLFTHFGELKDQGVAVHMIANRHVEPWSKKIWARYLPWRPLCTVPNVPYEMFVQAQLKGVFIQDWPDVLQQLQKHLQPLLRRMI